VTALNEIRPEMGAVLLFTTYYFS